MAFQNFKKGNSTNLKAYENLFTDPQLKPTLARMFLERYIQRALQLSRAKIEQKTHYIEKISVFQRAFIQQKFHSLQWIS